MFGGRFGSGPDEKLSLSLFFLDVSRPLVVTGDRVNLLINDSAVSVDAI